MTQNTDDLGSGICRFRLQDELEGEDTYADVDWMPEGEDTYADVDCKMNFGLLP